jgi:hypothetical protein
MLFPDGNIEWKLPSQMVICHDPLIQQVISPEMLEHHIGLFYLHNAVTSSNNTPLLQSLGIKQISTQHLLDIGKSLAKQWQDEEVEGLFLSSRRHHLPSFYQKPRSDLDNI